ncbi:MAG TPA: hypothetical protein DIS85_06705 [Vagococcus sp.]|uniref:Uncharacterized protein n=2 Tax=Enterococcaceae TaxID=81852 RepID=A0A1X6WMM9_9ENTE|nr:hypothetical protein FM121_05835 [Vagococcus fluvialis bH819]HCM89569.1 hypothetical protein [Vagococcus sp.]
MQAITDTMAIIYSMWFFIILVFLLVFVIYIFTGYILNPLLPIGLFFIYALFCHSENYQGIGWIVAILFTLIMLTAGRIVPQEEKEAKEKAEESLEKDKKLVYESQLLSIKDEQGNEIEIVEEPDKELKNRHEVKDDHKVYLSFIINSRGNPNEHPGLKEKDLEPFRIETDNVYAYLSQRYDDEWKYDEKTGILEGTATYSLNDYAMGNDSFKISLTSLSENMISRYAGYINIELIEKEKEKSEINTIESTEENSKPFSYSKEKKGDHKREETITENNIEDWEHILDDYELEEIREVEGYYD